MREPKDDHERKAIADVQNHGWHVLKVMGDSAGPAFAYTVGLHHSFGHPELIIVGLPLDVGHSVLNLAGESIRRGVRYSEGVQSDDFLENRACVFRTMPESQYRNYMGWALWFYDGASFPALQMIWADQEGDGPGTLQSMQTFAGLNPSLRIRAIRLGHRTLSTRIGARVYLCRSLSDRTLRFRGGHDVARHC